jgi:protein TonB
MMLAIVKVESDPAAASAHVPSLPDLDSVRPGPVGAPRGDERADRRVQAAAVCVALALHAGVVLALMTHPPQELEGAGGQHLEAIEVTIVQSAVFESRDTQQVEQAAAEKGEVTPEEGEQTPTKTEEPPLQEEMQASIEPEPQPPPPEEPPKPPESQPGATAAGVDASTPASGAAAAGAGVISRYAGEVRRALARNKPDGRGRQGTATITFTIAPEGKVKAAEITQSSGNALLDKAALASVERTSFPRPPGGMTERELTYVVPFRFR